MRTGKLSDEDYEAIDGALRAEAVQILERSMALARGRRARREAAGDEPEQLDRSADDG